MHRIDNSNSIASLPAPDAVGPNPDGFFTNGNSSGILTSDLPTKLSHDWLNAIQEEVCYVIEQSGSTLSKSNRTQLYTAINAMVSGSGGHSGILTAIHDDPSPTLGGDLEANAHKFYAPTSGTLLIESLSGSIDLNSATVLTATDVVHRGDTNNKITFGSSTQSLYASGSIIADINTSGLRLGNTGARITTIDNDTALAAASATRLATQHAAKSYIDTVAPTHAIIRFVYTSWSGSTDGPLDDLDEFAGTNIFFDHSGGSIYSEIVVTDTSLGALRFSGSPYTTQADITVRIWIDVAPGTGNSYIFTLSFDSDVTTTISGANTFATFSVTNIANVRTFARLNMTGSPPTIGKVMMNFAMTWHN